jgi:hypothetical protein
MEETKPTVTPPSTRPVMDIQPPKPPTQVSVVDKSDDVPTSAPEVSSSVTESVTAPAPVATADDSSSSTSEEMAPAPVATTPPAPVEEVKAPEVAAATEPTVSNDLQPATTEAKPAENPMAIPPKPAHQAHVPRGTIIVAIVVALLLAGTSIFAYLKTKDDTTTSNNNKTSQKATPAKVTTSDVSQTSQQIDDTLKTVDDTKDFEANDLGDTALGLQSSPY